MQDTRDYAVIHDHLRWLREDLEEALLDLKLAVIDLSYDRMNRYLVEASSLIAAILFWMNDHEQPGE